MKTCCVSSKRNIYKKTLALYSSKSHPNGMAFDGADKLLSTPKTKKFPAKSLIKLHEPHGVLVMALLGIFGVDNSS